MKADGGLRQIFSTHIREAHWQAVETGSTGLGVPDSNYCLLGAEGWIENKVAQPSGRLAHGMLPSQVGWIERRIRAGGRVFIAVRRIRKRSALHEARDDLYLFTGDRARDLIEKGTVEGVAVIRMFVGGPANWDWPTIKRYLTGGVASG